MASKPVNDDNLLGTSEFTKSQVSSRSRSFLAIVIISIASSVLAVIDLMLFLINNVRAATSVAGGTFVIEPAPSYFLASVGLFALFSFVYGLFGRSIKDSKSGIALASLVIGPFALIFCLLQLIGSAVLAGSSFLTYGSLTTTTTAWTNALYGIIDSIISILAFLLFFFVIFTWVQTLRKRQKPRPTKEAEKVVTPATPEEKKPEPTPTPTPPKKEEKKEEPEGPTTIYIPVPYPVPAPAITPPQQPPPPQPLQPPQPRQPQIVINQPPPVRYPPQARYPPPRPPYYPPLRPAYQPPIVVRAPYPYTSPFASGVPAMRRNPYPPYSGIPYQRF